MISKEPVAITEIALSLDMFLCAEFEVLTALLIKSSTFRDIMICSQVKGNG
jgi:hypothetical protein